MDIRLVANMSTSGSVVGAKLPTTFKLFFGLAARANGGEAQLLGLEFHEMAVADVLVVALTPPDPTTGEYGLVTLNAFFLITDGVVDPALSAQRERCADGRTKAAFVDAEGQTEAALIARLRRTASTVPGTGG